MFATDLNKLKTEAYSFLMNESGPCASKRIARQLFGASRHEEPVAQLLVRNILDKDSRFIRTHDNRWTVADSDVMTMPFKDATFVVVDLEATGSLVGVDRIIEVGVAVLERGQIVQQFSSLIKSDRKISYRVKKLTGIDHNDLIEAPDLFEVMPIVQEIIEQADVFVAHDVRFDMSFLRWELARQNLELPLMPGLCTVQVSQQLWPDLDGWRLVDLSRAFGVSHNHPHRAGEDALATAEVLVQVLEDASDIGAKKVTDLFRLDDFVDESDSSSSSSDVAG